MIFAGLLAFTNPSHLSFLSAFLLYPSSDSKHRGMPGLLHSSTETLIPTGEPGSPDGTAATAQHHADTGACSAHTHRDWARHRIRDGPRWQASRFGWARDGPRWQACQFGWAWRLRASTFAVFRASTAARLVGFAGGLGFNRGGGSTASHRQRRPGSDRLPSPGTGPT